MEMYHISAECFPMAKVGGLADVVGALPKYLNRIGQNAKVIIPKYETKNLRALKFESVFQGFVILGKQEFNYYVEKEISGNSGYELFVVNIPGLFDRENIYGFHDDSERFMAFQIAFLDWVLTLAKRPDILHCHDHHTGLIPFMVQECLKYRELNQIPVLFTIHNAQYQGSFSFDKLHYLPTFNLESVRYLEWAGQINPLASAVKCAWRVTTVSASYLQEMQNKANGLESLLLAEKNKSIGILNGIDAELWNPESDAMISHNYNLKSSQSGKGKNKKKLCKEFEIDETLPLFCFIGRLVYEKGADLLPELLRRLLSQTDKKACVFVLGSGDEDLEHRLASLQHFFRGQYNFFIGYNEALAHQVYAASDFLLMPSRVEPCGLNQMYAMRYGTIPVVCKTGGLKDTVVDIKDSGFGITHESPNLDQILEACNRGIDLYVSKEFQKTKKRAMIQDHSWEAVAKEYLQLYESLIKTSS